MPSQNPSKPRSRNIKRNHSGCRACRKRGKKCDEAKPSCRACIRLTLECIYGLDFQFRSFGTESLQKPARAVTFQPPRADALQKAPLCPAPKTAYDLDVGYLDHFTSHVRHLLPAGPSQLGEQALRSPCLKPAVLCISASNLSMLNADVQRRALRNDPRRSVFSPSVNKIHHTQAEKYHQQALSHFRDCKPSDIEANAPAVLTAYTLLAYYHHASTDHHKFRLAVWDTVRFVSKNRDCLTRSEQGAKALQMWYRLCVSHRLGKPPALLLEGEGGSSFGPNRYPDSFDQLYFGCIVGMSSDDLIYDILIKTIEIRSRLVVFRCVARSCGSSELSKNIGSTAHQILTKLLGRDGTDEERAEADNVFVRGSHLQSLLNIQRERLQVWKSQLRQDQQPGSCLPFSTHRDAMNALYSLLCEIMFDESCEEQYQQKSSHDFADTVIRIVDTLDVSVSATADIYTFSLSEVLLQLVQVYKSDSVFQYILDTLWPELERKARGYEHSHYPTHLVKRIIAQISNHWATGKGVLFALPAISDDIGKLNLLDIYHPIDLVICGSNEGRYFIDKVTLP